MQRNMQFAVIGMALASLTLGPTGCAGPAKVTKSAEVRPAADVSTNISGKVVETMDAGGYTYICLEKDGSKTWAAIPVSKVAVGDEVKILTGAEMSNFASKALNRTFDKIIFSGGLIQDAAPKASASAAATATGAAAAAAAASAPEPAILAGKVVETMGAASYTYILLEKDGKRGWAAVPFTDVKVGQEVELIPGVDMGSFTSTTLKRTFNNIHFSAGIKGAQTSTAADASKAATTPAAGTPALPPGHPKLNAATTTPPTARVDAQAAPITGTVVETAEAGGYTYICLEKDKVKTWVAVPPLQVNVGQQLTLAPGNEMHNFTSKTLNRTFEKIIFTSGPQSAE